MTSAVFLDRDGTLIEHVHYLSDPKDVKLVQGAAQAIHAMHEAGYLCVVVTNQSAIGRGMLTHNDLERIHDEVNRQLSKENAAVDAWYSCPIVPATDDQTVVEHPDRKPGPGMLLRAARELSIDVSQSWMIGDMISDALAGQAAGCKGSILTRNPHGQDAHLSHPAVSHVVAGLQEAVDLLLRTDGHCCSPTIAGSGDANERSVP